MTDIPQPAARPVILPTYLIVEIKRLAGVPVAALMLSYDKADAPLLDESYAPDVLRVAPVSGNSLPNPPPSLPREVTAVFVDEEGERPLAGELMESMATLMDEDDHLHALFPAPESWLAAAQKLGFMQLWATAPNRGEAGPSVIASRSCLGRYPSGELTFDSGRKMIRIPLE